MAWTFRLKWFAKPRAYDIPHATFRAVSGADLTGIPTGSIDFVFSFAVFQHVPDKAAIFNYFAETARVLRHGGIFRLHMKGLWSATVGRVALEAGFSNKPRLAERRPHARSVSTLALSRHLAGLLHPPRRGREQCESLGLEVLDVEDKWTTMMWVGGRKP